MLPKHLVETTSATRDYIANASDKEKSEKKTKQEWGLFETNYQRTKGITTDESLKEIEEFARTGVRPEATPGTVPWTPKTGNAGGASSATSSGGGASRFGRPAGGAGAGNDDSSKIAQTGQTRFPRGKGPGEAAFEKYVGEQKKYTPKPYQGKKWSTPGTQTK